MISNELLNKFDSIDDLPVSEEMLGAYLENNLSYSEMVDVESAIQENSYLSELADANYEYDVDLDLDFSEKLYIECCELPIIPDDSFIELDLVYSSSFPETEDFDYVAACAIEDQYLQVDSYNDDNIDNLFDDDDITFDSSDNNDISDYE